MKALSIPILLTIAGCAGDKSDSAAGPGDAPGTDTSQTPSITSDPSTPDTETTGSDTTPSGTETTDTTQTGTEPTKETVQALSGSIVWDVDFDEEAEARGYVDCSYQRDYVGIEDLSADWLCADCDAIFLLDVALSVGLEDCYSQFASAPAEQERLGWTPEAVFRRGAAPSYPMSEQGTITWHGDSFTTTNTAQVELTDGGMLEFEIDGQFEVSTGSGDPWHGWSPPESYACGWPRADPPAYTGDHSLAVGATLPDGYFADECGEAVRLHDFKDRYIVLDISAEDCPPCRSMAEGEPEFAAEMAAAGIDVSVITLLAPSLSAVLDPTPAEVLIDWADTYDLHDPVLGDRGWGYTLGNASLGEDFGYPTWMVVSPELEILDIGVGFSSWDDISPTILEHAAR